MSYSNKPAQEKTSKTTSSRRKWLLVLQQLQDAVGRTKKPTFRCRAKWVWHDMLKSAEPDFAVQQLQDAVVQRRRHCGNSATFHIRSPALDNVKPLALN